MGHQKASSLGLALRVTFRKPQSLGAPKKKEDFAVREKVVNACVKELASPQCLDMSEAQRRAMCTKMGANTAEVASALFLANYTQAQEQAQLAQQQQVLALNGIDIQNLGAPSIHLWQCA